MNEIQKLYDRGTASDLKSANLKLSSKQYLTQQLKYHIPNQLSGHAIGRSFLVTTSNLNDVNDFLKMSTTSNYNTTLVPANINVEDINNMLIIMEGDNGKTIFIR